ncbi:methyltransferase domain-containing protein [Mycobacterium lehmannii]|uniref:methyltransferase domain-containing protein n=1 Tax=Mycobacterium lehmannii TaxID=2048550 RepID=UPI00115516C0|nr:class I SAM-dependent methyltransferase [Mycobacterium lehmannii]
MTRPLAEIACRLSRPRVLATWIFDRLFDRVLDRRFGINSSFRASLTSLRLEAPDRAGYQPVSYLDFEVLMHAIDVNGIFVDFGSGAGRCVCLASQYPFEAVVGVELSDVLCAAARRNVIAAGVDGQIVCADATQFSIPPRATTFAFINPFRGRTMQSVLFNIRQSANKYPRSVTVLAYGSPVDFEFFDQFKRTEGFRMVRQVDLPTGCVAMIFENI